MLVESIVKWTLGFKSWRVKKVTGTKEELTVELVPRRGSRPRCSGCGKRRAGYDTLAQRKWRHIALWGIPVLLRYSPRRVSCPCCGIKVEQIPWTMGKSDLTVPLIVMLATFAKLLAWEEVARLFGVHWNTVKAAVARAVEFGLENRDTADVIAIGVDEISRRRGHTYVTNVYDLKNMRLLWTGDGRGEAVLERFFYEWGVERTKAIVCICCDMWDPYIKSIRQWAPQATVVFDKFHIVQHLMRAVDQVRVEEARSLKEKNPELLKRTRYLWLKNPWNLTPKQKARLGHLEKLNLRTNRAYLLKETFREFWEYKEKGWAKRFLKQWFWWATHSRLKPMRDFAWMLRRYEDGVLNYIKTRIDNGAVEGMNRKAKVLSQRAYGYRTFETFSLALYHVLGNLPMPELTHKFL
jgi:transposase